LYTEIFFLIFVKEVT